MPIDRSNSSIPCSFQIGQHGGHYVPLPSGRAILHHYDPARESEFFDRCYGMGYRQMQNTDIVHQKCPVNRFESIKSFVREHGLTVEEKTILLRDLEIKKSKEKEELTQVARNDKLKYSSNFLEKLAGKICERTCEAASIKKALLQDTIESIEFVNAHSTLEGLEISEGELPQLEDISQLNSTIHNPVHLP